MTKQRFTSKVGQGHPQWCLFGFWASLCHKSSNASGLIGVNTREMNAKDDQDRKWAKRAGALALMLSNPQANLLTGPERNHRYGWQLARLQDSRGEPRLRHPTSPETVPH